MAVDKVIDVLNDISKDYRETADQLKKERKEKRKEKLRRARFGGGNGNGRGPAQWDGSESDMGEGKVREINRGSDTRKLDCLTHLILVVYLIGCYLIHVT